MPWSGIKLSSGDTIPGLGYGTWKIPQNETVKQVTQAVDAGFDHIDTAQSYSNETQAGQALRESGLPRTSVWITTKYSGWKSVEDSIKDSLDHLGIRSVDLYLIHNPRLANGDIPGLWNRFQRVKIAGLAKNIGVSNFEVSDLKVLLKEAKIKPVVNQILLHPYVYERQRPIIELCHKEGIAIEAYSPLIPVTARPGGPVDVPLQKISKRTGATFDQILLAWNKAKGSIVLTSSSKKSRLEGYKKAGDLELTAEEIAEIDAAGAAGGVHMAKGSTSRTVHSISSFAVTKAEAGAEDVIPKANAAKFRTKVLLSIVLAVVSLFVTTALFGGRSVLVFFDCM